MEPAPAKEISAMPLKALAFNCTLKRSPAPSSTDKLLQELLKALSSHDVTGDIIRAVDYNIKPGVSSDEGEGDAWPELRRRIVEDRKSTRLNSSHLGISY